MDDVPKTAAKRVAPIVFGATYQRQSETRASRSGISKRSITRSIKPCLSWLIFSREHSSYTNRSSRLYWQTIKQLTKVRIPHAGFKKFEQLIMKRRHS